MKTLLLPILAFCGAAAPLLAAPTTNTAPATRQNACPAAGKTFKDLFWIADTRKMDAFLANVEMEELQAGSYGGEILPDTRVAWRDYALEARALSREGRNTEAAERLGQMLKLAAVYTSFGGLQNVVQAEEIRFLAGRTATKLGSNVAALIHSPYLEKDAADCLLTLEAKAGAEKNQVTPSFWRALERGVVENHYRLTSCNSVKLAQVP